MNPRDLLSCARSAAVGAALSALVACGGSTTSAGTSTPPDASTPSDATTTLDGAAVDGAPSSPDSGADSGPSPRQDSGPPAQAETVTFQYTPAWAGATQVVVIGGFGTSSDWMPKQPFATLTNNGSGTFTGTGQLAPGSYPYVFLVTGDVAAGSKAAAYVRYVIDPTNPAIVACPAASPTYDKSAVNPCSELTVPQGPAAPMNHLTGTVTYDGAPIAGYLVLLERNEPTYHHFAVNRTVTASDGSFDCVMAPGKYRVQVLYPTFYSQTDAERDPVTLQALRRSISGTQTIAAPATLPTAEVADHGYAMFAPVDAGNQALPVTFTYTVLPSAAKAALDLYGPGATIGDPWFTGAASTATTDAFDGGFNTTKATTPSPEAGTSYWWGATELISAVVDGGVGWEGETMVFPIVFQ